MSEARIHSFNDFVVALSNQARVVHALVIREMLTKFEERKLGFAWMILEPMLHVAMFVAIRYLLKGIETVRGQDVVPFLITGIIPYLYFRNVTSGTMKALIPR